MSTNCSAEHHDGRTCRMCASLRHPSKLVIRRALSGLPRQAGQPGRARETGGAN